MRSSAFFLVACALAFVAPLILRQPQRNGSETSAVVFPGWPTHFEGRPLNVLALSEREERFGRDFPGFVARFTDGEREVIMRWVTEPSRKLHPAADCFQAIGYRVRPLPLRIDEAGHRWGSFSASRKEDRLRVYERIYRSDDDSGESWTDVSAWYWAATKTEAPGAWWAITVAEKEREEVQK